MNFRKVITWRRDSDFHTENLPYVNIIVYTRSLFRFIYTWFYFLFHSFSLAALGAPFVSFIISFYFFLSLKRHEYLCSHRSLKAGSIRALTLGGLNRLGRG